MTIRTRIFLVYLLLVGGGFFYLVAWILEGVRPRYLESMEESLVDAVNVLAAFIETEAVTNDVVAAETLRHTFDSAIQRAFAAHVYSIEKKQIDLRIYVTDGNGRVLYDSDGGKEEGKDYSRWRDVKLTLQGQYGARATRVNPNDESTLVIHVAAPIRSHGRIVGAVTIGKPTKNINDLVAAAKRRIWVAGFAGGGLIVLTGFAFSVWLTTPIERLTAYARAVRDGKPATLPRLAGREVSVLRHAFEEMREALEGKKDVERYTQTLTHEIKAPLSAIRAAAELLEEDMAPAERRKFLGNIRHESARIQQIIDKLLQLSALEARKGLGATETVDLEVLTKTVAQHLAPTLRARKLALEVQTSADKPAVVVGEKFLLHQALANLLQNAVEFSPPESKIDVTFSSEDSRVCVTVEDHGPGIPAYALEKVFDRFYSLPRPDTGVKSTGLGLSFVREIAHLHRGEITLTNRPNRGCRATLRLPKSEG